MVYKAQYIRLAGRRDYAIYKYYGHKYLDLSYYLDINLDTIKNNPLTKITENKIYFKYEEIENGT
jgi:predicted RNA-binding protein associated with RNAse of E/G family